MYELQHLDMRVRRACCQIIHWQTTLNTWSKTATEDRDVICSPPLLMSLQQFDSSWPVAERYTSTHAHYIWKLTEFLQLHHSLVCLPGAAKVQTAKLSRLHLLFTRPQSSISHFPTMSFLLASQSVGWLSGLMTGLHMKWYWRELMIR